jgi:hypothetical protein
MAFKTSDAEKALPKGSTKAQAAWVKMANKAVGRGMSEDAAAAAATKMAGQMQEAKRLHMDLAEVGRVLNATNEKQLRTAAAAIDAVLKALDAGEEPAAEALRTVEAYSGEANDAARGIGVMTSIEYAAQSLLYLMSDESDEPDQVAMLQKAYEALMAIPPLVLAWVTAEIGEIGTPDDDEDEPAETVTSYSSTTVQYESMQDLLGDTIPLVESAVRNDGTALACLIKPGWGTSGYYSREVLQRDGPKVFTAGTKMFIDHPGYAEEADRPERSIRDIGGVLAVDAYYDLAGPVGEGLYSRPKPVAAFREVLNELAPDIGVSIRMKGTATTGEAEGKRGPIIERIIRDPLGSVDFVTVAGAGGQVIPLAESWRRVREASSIADPAAGRRTIPPKEVTSMDLQETQTRLAAAEKERDTALQEGARAKETLVLREAHDVVVAELAKAVIPEVTRARLAGTLGKNPPIKEGALDKDALAASVKEAVAGEVAYFAALTESGQVKGMGGNTAGAGPTPDELDKSLTESFRAIGMDEKTAALAAKGRG